LPKVIINGSLQPARQPIKVSYDPEHGLHIAVPWESAGNNLGGLALAYQQQRVAYEWEGTDRKSQLIASASGGQLGIPDLSTDSWEILGNEIQKSLTEHPDVLAMEDAYPGTIGYIKRDLDLYEQGLPNGDPAPDPGAFPMASSLYFALKRGATHFALGQYVLRHTTNVSNQYSQNVADFNIERIYTTSQLIAEVTNGNWTFPMPGRLVYKLQNLAAPTAAGGYLWGWRKLPSTETTTAGNRVQITTEYWLEQWNVDFIYKLAT
jgi:hypothetical protein